MGNNNSSGTSSSSTPQTMANLFDSHVGYNWGLRGDPYFWEILQEHFSHIKQPLNSEQFLEQVSKISMERCDGKDILKSNDNLLVKDIPRGGMSGGFISYEFWQQEAIPELLKRLEKYNNNNN
ncbi:predicted protein [Naegleria gruberi]|uniref:Predicted protein n=1 Tax=Naegleria gruberi TaxID=5762 RepID=D2VFU7_NAEGR|nr:uncharacterized protein NAEGRDRAFT_67749 [Naegleria gruberi]EFC44251.1 predicted protein [Naegleria gruberi]|eukprot:XP_002676995.1 predicted protein [Naegleria gruberi strain NEG-M]